MQKHEGSRHLASAERGRRPRWTPTETDKALLETIFVADSFPTFSVRKQLAEQLNVDSRQVQIWFQNRRQRERVRQGAAAREAEAAESGDGDCSPVRESKGAAPLAAPIPAEFTASGARAQIISAAARRYPARDSRGTAPDPLCHSVCARSSADAHPALPPLRAGESDLAGGGESSSASTSSEVGPAAHFSPTVGPSEAPAALSGGMRVCADLTAAAAGAEPSAVLRIEQLPDGRRVVHMAAGKVVEVPAEAPGALVQMLESASGSRAVQAAARSLAPIAAAAHAPSGAVPRPADAARVDGAARRRPRRRHARRGVGRRRPGRDGGGGMAGGVSPRARASAASREAVDALFALGSNRA